MPNRLICSEHHPSGKMPNRRWQCRIDDGNADGASWILATQAIPFGLMHRATLISTRGTTAAEATRKVDDGMSIELCSGSGAILDAYCHGKLSDGTKCTSQSLDFGKTAAVGPDDLLVGTLALLLLLSGKRVSKADSLAAVLTPIFCGNAHGSKKRCRIRG